MKFSQTAMICQESPMRKYHPYAVRAKEAGKKVYHLNIGQPDIPTPPAFFETVRNFSEEVLAYAPSPGVPALIDAVCDYYGRIGVELTPANVLITTGGSEALLFALTCILDAGDEIIVPEPYYPNYATFVAYSGAKVHPIATAPESGYRFADTALLESAVTEKTRALMLANPGNPCGTVLTREEIRLVADFAKKHDMWLIADEVYREFVYGGEELMSFAQLEDIDDRLILIDSVSKRFSACGARIGCLISKNAEFMAHALKFCQSRLSVATLDQVASTALYSVEGDYFETVREEYKKRRDTVYRKITQIPGVVCTCPGGAFYMMAKLPVDDAEKFQIWLLEHFEDRGETVMFSPGKCFYATEGMGLSEIRIAYVLKQEDLERAMDLLALGIEAYNKR